MIFVFMFYGNIQESLGDLSLITSLIYVGSCILKEDRRDPASVSPF